MKRILLNALLICLAYITKSQTNHYRFEVKTDAYTELSGDIALTQIPFGSSNHFEIKELYGDSFSFFNKLVTADTLTKGVLIFPNALVEVIDSNNLMVFDGLLRQLDSIDNTSKISYKIEGSANKKIIKVQWKNLRIQTGQPGNYVNLQVWLYQENGVVEFRYGPVSADNLSGYTSITGPSIGIFYSTQTLSNMFKKIWIYGTPPNIMIDSAKNLNFPNISGVPGNGTVYRFAPKNLSVNRVDNSDTFSVYPNPANTILNISTQVSGILVKATLIDMQGRVVAEHLLDGQTKVHRISIATLPNGIYEIKLQGKQQTDTRKIEIKH